MEESSHFLGNLFLNRLVLSFLTLKERLHTIALLNKYFLKMAYDCSLIQKISLSDLVDAHLSYDIQDYLLEFLQSLQRPEELKSLDLSAICKGEPASDELLEIVSKFKALSELRFPPASRANWKLLSDTKFSNCKIVKLPLLLQNNSQFLGQISSLFPNLTGLQIDFQNAISPLPQIQAPYLDYLALRLGQTVSQETRAVILTMIKTVSKLKVDLPNLHLLMEIFGECKETINNLIDLQLALCSQNPQFQTTLNLPQLRSLKYLKIKQFTPNFMSIVKQNENLEELSIVSVYSQKELQFMADSFLQLKKLFIDHDKMGSLKLYNLPSLVLLSVPFLKLESTKTYEAQSSLGLLSCKINYLKLPAQMDLDLKFENVASIELDPLLQISDPTKFTNIISLTTNDTSLLNLQKESNKIIRLELLQNLQIPMQECLDSLINLPSLRSLTLWLQKEDPLLKFIQIQFPQIVRFSLNLIDHSCGQVQISSKCKNLQEIRFFNIASCNFFINAPNLQQLSFQSCTKMELFVQASTTYSVKFTESHINISRCPGIKALYIEDDIGLPIEAEALQKHYYPYLRTIQAINLRYYEYKFWEELENKAPDLHSLSLEFAHFIKQTSNQDKLLIVKHSQVEWVDLKKGHSNFEILKIHKDCSKLKLVKFRDFELIYFSNEANAAFFSEKNLVGNKHFE